MLNNTYKFTFHFPTLFELFFLINHYQYFKITIVDVEWSFFLNKKKNKKKKLFLYILEIK